MSTTKEKIKNVLIGLLLIGMLYLTYTVWFFDSPFESTDIGNLFGIDVSFERGGEGTGTDLDVFGIRPMSILAKGDGFCRGAVYDSTATDAAYKILRDGIAHAFDTAGEMKPSAEDEWIAALSGNGVFLDYYGNVPTEALRMWLGESYGEGVRSGRYYMLSAEEKNIKIYVKNSVSGEVWVMNSSAASEELLSLASGLNCPDAALALMSGEKDYGAIAPETVIVTSSVKPPQISAYNAYATFASGVSDACLESFSLSDVSPGTYSETDGTQVYIADMVTMKISPAGILSYTDPRDETDETIGISVEYEGDKPTLAEKTERARALSASLASKLPGSGGIYLISAEENGDETEIVFGRHSGGIPVDMHASAYFMRVSLRDDMISAARVNLRGYDVTSQSADILSLRLAAAAVAGSEKKGELSLRYADTGASLLSPAWFIAGADGKEDGDELVES